MSETKGRKGNRHEVAADETASHVTFVCEECGKSLTFSVDHCGRVETCPHCDSFVDVPMSMHDSLATESQTAVFHETRSGEPTSELNSATSSSRTTAWLWFEVSAVLFLAVIPDLVYSVEYLLQPISHPSWSDDIYLIVRASGFGAITGHLSLDEGALVSVWHRPSPMDR